MQFVTIKNPKKPGASLVLAKKDFDPTVHELFEGPKGKGQAPASGGGGAPSGNAGTPAAATSIVTLSVPKSTELVAAADSVEALAALEQAEQAHPKYAGGRQGVLDAIAARREALQADAS